MIDKNKIIKDLVANKNNRLTLSNDYVFKKIFSKPENNDALKDFLEVILNRKIGKVEVKSPELPKNYKEEKLGILDIKAYIDDDTVVNIEMQQKNVGNMVERNLVYIAKLITEMLHVNDKYEDLKTVISISVLGENLLKRNSYHNLAHIKFEETSEGAYVFVGYKKDQEVLTNKVELHYIELKKFKKKNNGVKRKEDQWLWMLTGNRRMIMMASRENAIIKKVADEIEEMNQNEDERWEAFKRQVETWSINKSIREAHETGERNGMRKGLKKGKKEGIKEGIKKSKIAIAKKMKEEKVDIDFIIKITGLTKEEIEKI